MHEIITLQLGQRSNYLATHFWNSQESYFTYATDEESLIDHDIHFRAGIGVDGTETFMPRTVIYDLKGGFGALRKLNALYELQEEALTPQGLWNGPTIIQREATIERSAYQQSLEDGSTLPQLTKESVRYWSDFNRVYFHPRSIVQLNEYEFGSSLTPFEKWNIGEDLFSSLDKDRDLLDCDLRPFVEEADHLQAIQLMTSVDDAWGGFAARYMDRLRDEYGKLALWTWGLEDEIRGSPHDKQSLRLSNTARFISEISSQASLFVPMSMPSRALPHYVHVDRKSSWHVSALFSTALESMTLPSRLRAQDGLQKSLDEITGALNVNGNQNIAKLQMSIHLESTSSLQPHGDDRPGRPGLRSHSRDPRVPSRDGLGDGLGVADETPTTMDMDFFFLNDFYEAPGRRISKRVHIFGEAENFRGSKDPSGTNVYEEENRLNGRERARRRAAGLKILLKTHTPLSYSLLDSFPHIYYSDLSLKSVLVRTSLSTDSSVALGIRSLQTVVRKSISSDEREALSNSLGEIAEAYDEGWDSGSDEDDD